MTLSRRSFLGAAAALALPIPKPVAATPEVWVGAELWALKTPAEVTADINALFAQWTREISIAAQIPEHMLLGRSRELP